MEHERENNTNRVVHRHSYRHFAIDRRDLTDVAMKKSAPDHSCKASAIKRGDNGAINRDLTLTALRRSIVMVAGIPMSTFRTLKMDIAQPPTAKATWDFE